MTIAGSTARRRGRHELQRADQARNQMAERETRTPADQLARLSPTGGRRCRLLEDEDVIAPGIRACHTGVHDRGRLALAVETQRGTVIYSDSAYQDANVEQRCPIDSVYDLDEVCCPYDRIDATADLILAGFDPTHLTRFPDGVVA